MTVAESLLVWATASGRHPLAVYVALLASLLAVTWAGSQVLRRVCQRRCLGSAHRLEASFLNTVIAGAICIGVGLTIFSTLALQLSDGHSAMREADQALSEALRANLAPLAMTVFKTLTHLGDTFTLTALGVVVGILLGAGRHYRLALGWVVALAGNGAINDGLKQLVGRARPLLPVGGDIEPGYSFPSGHSSGITVACGMLAYLAFRLLPPRWHRPACFAAVTLIFTVGASRVFLQVHFASDVLAGFASGSVWLALCVTGLELFRPRGFGPRLLL